MAAYRVKPGHMLVMPKGFFGPPAWVLLPPGSEVILEGDLERRVLANQWCKVERITLQGTPWCPTSISVNDSQEPSIWQHLIDAAYPNQTEDRGLRAPSRDRAVRPKGKCE